MTLTEIILIAFGVSVDAAAVSVSGSLCPGKYSKRRCAFNAALFFGGFQFFMPLAGFFSATFLTDAVAAFDHYLACGLLTSVGGKMIYESFCKKKSGETCPLGEFFSAGNLFFPAIATSLDAFAIGASFAFNKNSVWLPAAMMGGVTAAVSAFCVILGKRLAATSANEKIMTIAGGSVIIFIGIKILLQDLGVL